MVPKFLAKAKLENSNTDKYLALIDEKLNKQPFLSGAEAGMHDISLYGMLNMFAEKPTMKGFQDMCDKSEKFAQWWLKMYQKVGEVD